MIWFALMQVDGRCVTDIKVRPFSLRSLTRVSMMASSDSLSSAEVASSSWEMDSKVKDLKVSRGCCQYGGQIYLGTTYKKHRWLAIQRPSQAESLELSPAHVRRRITSYQSVVSLRQQENGVVDLCVPGSGLYSAGCLVEAEENVVSHSCLKAIIPRKVRVCRVPDGDCKPLTSLSSET